MLTAQALTTQPTNSLAQTLTKTSDQGLVQLLSQPTSLAASNAEDAALRREVLMTLYDRHCRFCFTIALRLLGDREQAEAAVQTVYENLWLDPLSFSRTGRGFQSCLLTALLDHVAVLRQQLWRRPNTWCSQQPHTGSPLDVLPDRPASGVVQTTAGGSGC